jgi:putative membrane protein insertion efficiency factor
VSATVARETVSGGNGPDVSRETRPGPLTWLALLPIRAYRRFLSPLVAPRCRYYPTCSTYAEQAIRELGAVRGSVLAVWRVLRCNPFSPGGVDHVADRTIFRKNA